MESILSQKYTDIELVLVNDGSVDRTGAICEDFRKNDARVRVVHKLQNEGLGAARNTGLEMAVGDYILFLDADDWIDPNHISDLYELMIRTESDVAIANFTRYFQADERYELHIFPEDYYEKVLTPPEWFACQTFFMIWIATIAMLVCSG
ncbi:glycosyltransferase family 2 protein, partial [Streptococcus hyovaginalis]|uniref:glycosyltransferase family 2 protein n=1 Tax=Streptococcus hyovaginalis TaxID=149015 RepID=UPI002A91FD9F